MLPGVETRQLRSVRLRSVNPAKPNGTRLRHLIGQPQQGLVPCWAMFVLRNFLVVLCHLRACPMEQCSRPFDSNRQRKTWLDRGKPGSWPLRITFVLKRNIHSTGTSPGCGNADFTLLSILRLATVRLGGFILPRA